MGASSEEVLSTGWEPEVPATDTIVRRYILDWAGFAHRLGSACGVAYRDDHVAIGDCSSTNGFLNIAVLVHPRAASTPSIAVDRACDIFTAREGGGFTIASPWPTADLRDRGLSLMGRPPLMLRPAGGGAPPPPDELEIRHVTSLGELRTFERVAERAWGQSAFGYPDAILEVPGWTMWLGFLDGEPVATAAASLANGIVRVEEIACLPEVRGRGIGAAMSWTATLVDPTRDAVLIASDLGRGIYEAMGYRALDRFTLWQGTRGAP